MEFVIDSCYGLVQSGIGLQFKGPMYRCQMEMLIIYKRLDMTPDIEHTLSLNLDMAFTPLGYMMC